MRKLAEARKAATTATSKRTPSIRTVERTMADTITEETAAIETEVIVEIMEVLTRQLDLKAIVDSVTFTATKKLIAGTNKTSAETQTTGLTIDADITKTMRIMANTRAIKINKDTTTPIHQTSFS